MLHIEPLTESNLGEVVEFVHRANPFSQKTWGWDSGRFMDWRWGSNSLREAASPGWFGENCRVFRDGAEIRAVWVSEGGGDDVCVITPVEDSDAVTHVLSWLESARAEASLGISFEFANEAEWLRDLFGEAGLHEESFTAHEWEYDLSVERKAPELPGGFVVETREDGQPGDHAGIAECIRAAFDTTHDVQSMLISIELNPMFRPELSVFVRSPEGRIAAYCRGTVNPDNGVCGIDPVCSHPGFQRMGLAKAVVLACFQEQRRLGGEYCYIGSAPEPAPSTHLYRSLGPKSKTTACRWTRTRRP